MCLLTACSGNYIFSYQVTSLQRLNARIMPRGSSKSNSSALSAVRVLQPASIVCLVPSGEEDPVIKARYREVRQLSAGIWRSILTPRFTDDGFEVFNALTKTCSRRYKLLGAEGFLVLEEHCRESVSIHIDPLTFTASLIK